MTTPTGIEGLQTTLASEHAAVWILGVLGGQISPRSETTLGQRISSAYAVHRGRRDQLVRWIRDAGETPIAAESAYVLPSAVATVAEIREAARALEDGCAEAYADLVGRTTGAQRTWAIAALIDAATREMGFGGTAETLPGIPG